MSNKITLNKRVNANSGYKNQQGINYLHHIKLIYDIDIDNLMIDDMTKDKRVKKIIIIEKQKQTHIRYDPLLLSL